MFYTSVIFSDSLLGVILSEAIFIYIIVFAYFGKEDMFNSFLVSDLLLFSPQKFPSLLFYSSFV